MQPVTYISGAVVCLRVVVATVLEVFLVSGAFSVLFAKKRRRCQQNIVSLPLPGKEIDMP